MASVGGPALETGQPVIELVEQANSAGALLLQVGDEAAQAGVHGLNPDDIEFLKRRDCACSDWSRVRLLSSSRDGASTATGRNGRLEAVIRTEFKGDVLLSPYATIQDSTVENSVVMEAAKVVRCDHVCWVVLMKGAQLISCGTITGAG